MNISKIKPNQTLIKNNEGGTFCLAAFPDSMEALGSLRKYYECTACIVKIRINQKKKAALTCGICCKQVFGIKSRAKRISV